MGTTIENKRRISREKLQKKRTKMGTTSQVERRGMEGRNERGERVLMQILDSKIQSFYNEQLKRDEDVLTFLDKREEKLERSMLQKAEGFKYLYKE